MDNDFSYKCECGQYFGKDLYARRYVCGICHTTVTYRSRALPEFIKPTNIVDLIYEKGSESEILLEFTTK